MTTVSIVAAAIELSVAGWALSLIPGRRRRHATLAYVALSAAACAASYTVLELALEASAPLTWPLRLYFCALSLHVSAWVAYVHSQLEDARQSAERIATGIALALGASTLLPGAVVTPGSGAPAWAGVAAEGARLTAFGSVVLVALPLVLLGPLLSALHQVRVPLPGARAQLAALVLVVAGMLLEAVSALGLWRIPYAIVAAGFAGLCLVWVESLRRVSVELGNEQAARRTAAEQLELRSAELAAARENLIQLERLSALGRLSATVAHEINNPLSYVIGNLDYTAAELRRQGGAAHVVEALTDASSGADQIRKIVRELRVFSRGAEREHRERLDPREPLEAAIKLVWGKLHYRAQFVRELGPIHNVLADSARLTQVFVNLLMNAIQAIPEERAGTRSAVVTVRSRNISENLTAIEINDTGSGMAQAVRARLFEPFFSTKPPDEGTGLGLFVSAGIVNALGGHIDIESRLGAGTTARVVLPATTASPRIALESAPPESLFPPSSRRLLVVDDDVLVARTLTRLLGAHQVEVAANGRDALARLTNGSAPFDLVFCDLMMPDMSGMDVYEEIARKHPPLADRFVFISGGGISERSQKFIELHSDRVLAKPIDGRQLSEIVEQRISLFPPHSLAYSRQPVRNTGS